MRFRIVASGVLPHSRVGAVSAGPGASWKRFPYSAPLQPPPAGPL